MKTVVTNFSLAFGQHKLSTRLVSFSFGSFLRRDHLARFLFFLVVPLISLPCEYLISSLIISRLPSETITHRHRLHLRCYFDDAPRGSACNVATALWMQTCRRRLLRNCLWKIYIDSHTTTATTAPRQILQPHKNQHRRLPPSSFWLRRQSNKSTRKIFSSDWIMKF